MRDDRGYLPYILESIELIEKWTASGRTVFDEDVLVREAVLRRLETLADAASHLSTALKGRYPTIDWRLILDFRNWLAHGYADLDLDTIWQTVEEDLPQLKLAVESEMLAGS